RSGNRRVVCVTMSAARKEHHSPKKPRNPVRTAASNPQGSFCLDRPASSRYCAEAIRGPDARRWGMWTWLLGAVLVGMTGADTADVPVPKPGRKPNSVYQPPDCMSATLLLRQW